jgi:pantoate--beta-alanine ligase
VTALVRTRAALFALRSDLGTGGADRSGPVVLVPTMGALHDGHRELLRTARSVAGAGGSVIVSVFVNPLQFGPGEDLDRYPRTLDDDMAMCSQEGVTAVFAPSAGEMYPDGKPSVTVDPGPIGALYEGAFRPGFFGGVLTVVLKLFSLVRPSAAVFGEKDAQQLAMVRRMMTDFDLGVSIVAVPTVRDAGGLAISSRNRYLSAAERAVALALPRALQAGVTAGASACASACASASAGAGAGAVLAAARRVLDAEPGLTVDYLALVDPVTFAPVEAASIHRRAVLAVAARVGATRLIDNVPIDLCGGSNCC